MAAVWATGLLLSVLAPASRAQVSVAYEEPDLTTPLFDVNRLGLDAAARRRLAAVLAAGITDYNATLDAKILGVALRLDPDGRPARDASERRRRGALPDPKLGALKYPATTVASYLAGMSTGLRTKGGTDNLALAGYLSALAVDLDPTNPAAMTEKDLYARSNPPPSWKFLRGSAAPDAIPEFFPLLKQQSKIRGLGVSELDNGSRTGAVLEIIVTAEGAPAPVAPGPHVGPSPTPGLLVGQPAAPAAVQAASLPGPPGVAVTALPVGESMRIALGEAERAVKLRHPTFGAGQRLVVSFGQKYSSKDGPSAGTAFALVLYSLYDPLRFAEDCAITGDITVDGRVRAVGAVPTKIHAALVDGCHLVAIPKENAADVADVPILYPANTLWKLQIFTVDTLDEALAVMRTDRPADLQRAIDLFATVQQSISPGALRLGAVNANLVPTLKEVLRLAPGHASAAAMLRSLEGRAPATLSLRASLDELDRITDATLHAAKTEGQPGVDLPALAEGVNRLESLRPQMDFRAADLCAATLSCLRTFQRLSMSPPTAAERTAFRQQVDALDEIDRRMSTDPALVEALR